MTDTVQEMTLQAEALLESGQLPRAKALYQQITRAEPENAEAWMMLGAVNGELGMVDEAIANCRRAIDIDGEYIEAMVVLSQLLGAQGRLAEAADWLQRVVRRNPEDDEAWGMLAGIQGQLGVFEEAARCSRELIRLRPHEAGGYASLGNALVAMGCVNEAIAPSSRAAELDPNNAIPWNLLGQIRERNEEWSAAASAYQQAVSLEPGLAGAWAGLGRTHQALGDRAQAEQAFLRALQCNPRDPDTLLMIGSLYDEQDPPAAETHYRRALELRPNFVPAWVRLGNLLQNQNRVDEAEACYERALSFAPEDHEAHYNRGVLRQQQGRLKEALACFDRAIASQPDFALAHWNKSFIHLLEGDYEQGWHEYEWRLRRPDTVRRPFTQPRWDGSDLQGQTILVHDEQGYGDTFQFVRYLPLVRARGGRVVFECHPGLGPVLQGCTGCDQLVERTSLQEVPTVPFDTDIPLVSLPGLFGTRIDAMPVDIPYLQADPVRVDRWRKHLADDRRFRIGIVWEGSPRHTNNLNRSCTLADFAPLSRIAGVSLYSLQKGPDAEQAARHPDGMDLIRLDQQLDLEARFVDTAAVMMSLDLIISIDTAAAHLAGALGRPVWTLVCATPDWRWLLERPDTPWYPGMRLFRQRQPGHWGDVFERVADELEQLIASRAR